MYRKYKIHPSSLNESNYKKYKNKLKSLLNFAERSYYSQKLKSCAGNSKQLWETLNLLLNKQRPANIDLQFNINGHVTTDPKAIEENFNDFFINIGKNLAAKIPTTSHHFASYLNGSYIDSFKQLHTDINEILNVVKLLPNKKAQGMMKYLYT